MVEILILSGVEGWCFKTSFSQYLMPKEKEIEIEMLQSSECCEYFSYY